MKVTDVATPETIKSLLPVDIDLGGLTLGQYLTRLEGEVVTPVSAAEEGRIVYELSLRRELIRLGEDIANAGERRHLQSDAEFCRGARHGVIRARLMSIGNFCRVYG